MINRLNNVLLRVGKSLDTVNLIAYLGIGTMTCGLFVVLGYVGGNNDMSIISGSGIPMALSTAITFIIVGIAILLTATCLKAIHFKLYE